METSGKKSSKGGTFWVACLAILALPVGAPLLLAILAVLACVLVCVAIALVCVLIFAICLLLVGGKLWIRGLFAIIEHLYPDLQWSVDVAYLCSEWVFYL